MVKLVFLVPLLSGLLILALALISMIHTSFQFWPPPSKASWQYHSFWWLFRVLFVGILILSVLDFNGLGNPVRFYVGIVLALIGLLLAFYITFYLGWKNAHGVQEGLVETGWYAWSRNPVYLVSLLGFVGWSLAVHSFYVYTLFVLLTLFYGLAPFLEEPWLAKKYGDDYLRYKAKVPRFLGIPKGDT